jgi:hypothetical protein
VTPGPTPGNTPTTMPKAAPIKSAMAMGGDPNDENPLASASMNSMFKKANCAQSKP